MAGDCRRLGDLDAARRHLRLGLAAADRLDGDGYGHLVRDGVHRLADG